MREVYLDNISTTKPYPEVVRVMTKVAETLYGNPSSSHEVGKKARRVVERARATLARYLKEPCKAIVFTSGATESMNIVLNGVMEKHGYDGVVLTSTIEHPAGIKPLEHLHKRHKVEVVKIPVDGEGFIDLEALKEAMKKHGSRVKLVTIMYANNEIGTLQDLRAIRKIVGKRVHFHSDTTQAAGKFRIRGVGALDSYVVSGHKIHSVKGVGALVLRRDPSCLSPLSWGGGQEKAVRPGTESPPLICALAEAVRLNCVRGAAVVNKMRKLRKALVTRCAELGGIVNGPRDPDKCLPNLASIAFPVRSSRAVVKKLAKKGIAVSTGSACHLLRRSETLQAIGLPMDREKGTIRIGLCHSTSASDINDLCNALKTMVLPPV